MGAGPIIIPFVALLIPILLILMVIFYDVLFISWAAFRVWHDREPGFATRLLHRLK